MANLSNILGGPWSPPAQVVESPESQLRTAMIQAGINPPDELFFDGKIHRFKSGTKGAGGHDKPGWYLVFGDGIPAGRFGCWRSGVEGSFRADVGRKLTASEEMAHARRLVEAKAARDAALERQHEVAADTVEAIWSQAQAAHPDHPYLARKGIQTHGARITGDGRLVVPLFDDDGTIASLQYIGHDGTKLYHPGAQTRGKYWILGTFDEPGTIYIAEGFATAATIHQVTGRPCVVAYSASNLVPVAGSMRERHGQRQDIVIVADNDASGVGQRYAEQASAKFGARVVSPPTEGDANDYVASGGDLSSLLAPSEGDWLIPADDFSAKPAPISWMVKHWLQSDALVMVHGPSGGGKTFVVLDWCLHIASGKADWCGHRVKPGNVVYLAGEGHHGLRGRIAAWKHSHPCGPLSMWLSKNGCDLNTPVGYLKVVEQVRSLPEPPAVIVVDTLHRFLAGDENSAQDAKTMLDACNALMAEFCCSVVLVHHTGVSEDAQHRARGSSAWRGALDIEISIVPAKDGNPMEIVQRKSKDAEIAKPAYVSLKQVTLPGWLDEDGQPVTSAIVVQEKEPETDNPKPKSKLEGYRKLFESAWWASGAEERDGVPYLSRSALKDKLEADGYSQRTVTNMCSPSYPDKMIGALVQSETISTHEHGWKMMNETHASAMLLRKAGDKATP
ncbi:Archaeal primase DnaG/twinkle, TOPRIM domain [uncultured Caudovirales phage]|uniref:Archaeal primase DnaG/twinkle, TOPRIM domain n=1 Tax=uncultured Caudovirales phage TaxID=2100421 RepID=A0A6J5NCZ2_9CAUD|nr:Archaeal primase DnaG/twinkle, TOPRIM domain [uncultured Caudovirales phage]CAB4140403.1 Archaeal primase DnaG/twinkle, TOPRIM domain [uncultured Caudovirales phage]CAB4156959.1 Archaeal primase DnaG/twinkle, TOPRIM domain [uncultured Caudovirales phage]